MAKSDLKILLKPEKDLLTITLIGEAHFDIAVSNEQVETVMALKPKRVVIDATQMNFVSSTGICFLINVRKAIRELGGSVSLLGLQPLVKQALEHAHVLKLFDEPSKN